MKKLILLMVVMLSGCAAVDAVLMTKFDSNEYQIITEIRLNSEKYVDQCNDPEVSKSNAADMAYRTRLFELYSQELPRNGDGVQAATALNEIAQGLAKKYNNGDMVSPLFCKLKFEGIEHSADTIRHVLANRPR
jgi:hypothetical protein